MRQQTHSTLEVFYKNWGVYQGILRERIAALTDEQLLLQPAVNMRSVGQIVEHIVAVRAGWFGYTLQEETEVIKDYMGWGQGDSPARNALELARGLDETWKFIESRLRGWTAEDCARTFPDEWRGKVYQVSRSWVIFHVMEHDLHHGGEVSVMLGMNGLRALEFIDGRLEYGVIG